MAYVDNIHADFYVIGNAVIMIKKYIDYLNSNNISINFKKNFSNALFNNSLVETNIINDFNIKYSIKDDIEKNILFTTYFLNNIIDNLTTDALSIESKIIIASHYIYLINDFKNGYCTPRSRSPINTPPRIYRLVR